MLTLALLTGAGSPAGANHAGSDYTLAFLGEHIIETGRRFGGTTVGGLSAIDYDPARDVYYALSDARGEAARFYTLRIELTRQGIDDVAFTGVTPLTDEAGLVFGTGGNASRPDPEGLRFDAATQKFYWCSEGDGSPALNPRVRMATIEGKTVQVYAAPARFRRIGVNHGVRRNRSLESLALSSDGLTLYTANESALLQDGAAAAPEGGTRVRIVAIDPGAARVTAEYAYPVGPVPHVPPGHSGAEENGLVELLALAPDRLLALERAWVAGIGNYASLYVVDLRHAVDVSALDSLSRLDASRVLAKQRIAALEDFDVAIRNARATTAFAGERRLLDNLEGMTFGPDVDGARTIVFVSDNNFGLFGPQFTQFLAFRLVPAR